MKKSIGISLILFLCLSMFTLAINAQADGTAYYAKSKPQIDGAIDELWATVPKIEAINGDEEFGVEFGGYVKVLWDEEYLYILGDITDDTLATDEESNPSAESMDLWLSESNKGSDGYSDPGEWAVTFTPQGVCYVTFVNGEFYSTNPSLLENIEYAVATTKTGYIVEAKIRYITKDLKPTAGSVIGFNVTFNNDSDFDGARNSFRSWVDPIDPYWESASNLQKIELSATAVEAAAAEPETTAEPEATEAPAETAVEQAPVTVSPKTSDAAIMLIAAAAFSLEAILKFQYRARTD